MKIKNLEQFLKKIKELTKEYELDIEMAGILKKEFLIFDNKKERLCLSFTKKINGN
jgi:hypothetical protein